MPPVTQDKIDRYLRVKARSMPGSGSTPSEQEAARRIMNRMEQDYPGVGSAALAAETRSAAGAGARIPQPPRSQTWPGVGPATTPFGFQPGPTPEWVQKLTGLADQFRGLADRIQQMQAGVDAAQTVSIKSRVDSEDLLKVLVTIDPNDYAGLDLEDIDAFASAIGDRVTEAIISRLL